mmetsp:Transcript_39350/g.93993  ORF Transcript_39350/g.93993 Transcript_39350/m.93993 type:complete len:349 (+) Transcript_39350:789-1835(+)
MDVALLGPQRPVLGAEVLHRFAKGHSGQLLKSHTRALQVLHKVRAVQPGIEPHNVRAELHQLQLLERHGIAVHHLGKGGVRAGHGQATVREGGPARHLPRQRRAVALLQGVQGLRQRLQLVREDVAEGHLRSDLRLRVFEDPQKHARLLPLLPGAAQEHLLGDAAVQNLELLGGQAEVLAQELPGRGHPLEAEVGAAVRSRRAVLVQELLLLRHDGCRGQHLVMKVLMCFVVQQEVEAEGAVALEEAGNSRLRRPVRILDRVAVLQVAVQVENAAAVVVHSADGGLPSAAEAEGSVERLRLIGVQPHVVPLGFRQRQQACHVAHQAVPHLQLEAVRTVHPEHLRDFVC